MRVENMLSKNSGRGVANQFRIYDKDTGDIYFQSYGSIIAVKRRIMGLGDTGFRIELDTNTWNYSRTTTKYRSQFLGETTKETEKKIKDGTYKLTNLN